MANRSMGMDVFDEDGDRYAVRLNSIPDSRDLELTVFEGFAGGVQMHAGSVPVSTFLADLDTRRLFHKHFGVLFPVETFGVIKTWIRLNWELGR